MLSTFNLFFFLLVFGSNLAIPTPQNQMEAAPPPIPTRHVVAMAYPARGHVNAMMNTCKQLVSKNSNILVTLVLTEEWISLLLAAAADSDSDHNRNIRLRSIPNVVPSEQTRINDHLGFMEAVMSKLEEPFENLLMALNNNLEPPPTVIVYDILLYWVVSVGIRRNIPVAAMSPLSASFVSVLHHYQLLLQNENGHCPVNLSEDGDKLVDYIPGISPTRLVDFPLNKGNPIIKRTMELSLKGIQCVHKAQFLIFTSIYELEPNAIDALKAEFSSLPIYTIGPAIPYFTLQEDTKALKNSFGTNNSHSYLEWLDAQPNCSVLYISQGSIFSVSSVQIDEVASGLRESGVRFIWVARGEVSRLKEICGEKGLIVSWCDQLRVLCHPSIGGFWSHCGWNSTKEGVFAGVPFLTFPLVFDQPMNSKMIVEDWKVGWRVKEDVKINNSLLKKDEIARLMRKFMDIESDIGREIRGRARKLRQICQHAIEHGGSAEIDLDHFVRDIMKIT